MHVDYAPSEMPPQSTEEPAAEPERGTLFSWADPSPLFGALFGASAPQANNEQDTSNPPLERRDGLELEELGAAQGLEEEAAAGAPSSKTYGCSWSTQLKLVCWKNFLTYVRDKKTLGAYVVYPCIMCLLSFSFRRIETLPLDQDTNLDYLLLAEGMILVPMLQSLALVNERRTGQRELMALHGLSPFIYRAGFLISELALSMVMAFAICMFSLFLRVMGPVESLVSFVDLFVVIVVFCISSCSLIMAMSPFFRKPMTAAMVIFLTYFGAIFIFLLAGGSDEAFIHDNVGRDLFFTFETKICRDLYSSDAPLYSGVRHINLYKDKKEDPDNKGAMRKWWKFSWLDKAARVNEDDCDDGTNQTAGCSGDSNLVYCYATGTWGKCPWEINKYDLGPTNCTGLINVYGVENVCGKTWKKITNRKKFDDRVKNGYYQSAKDKTAYYTPQDEYPPMSEEEAYSLKVGLAQSETFNKNDYMLSPDWKHGRSKSGGFGICTDTCHNCIHEGYSNHKQKWMCLVPIWGIMFAVAGLKQGEAPVPLDKNLSTMLLAAFLLQIVAWYFGNVLPSDFGVRRKWNFFMSLRYWGIDKSNLKRIQVGCARKFRSSCPCLFGGARVPPQDRNDSGGVGGGDGEEDEEPAVIVENLRKIFGGKESRPAVDDVSFKVMHSEIFALLGHNGAGKTTTISMLTGMLEPSAGQFSIHGYRLESGMSEIYKRMGYCPQHDILFEFLTAAEHVEMFARLKGAPTPEAAEKERAAILAAFELTERADFFAYALSGGMRRKVCVALSLTGDTKFVVLDEPSAGLDPGARRRLWQTLATLKQGRSILLTTHYMDEAEILADRVSIMKDGKIACTGTAIELKEEYKCGYELVVSKTPAQQAKAAAYLEGLGVRPGSEASVKASEQPNNPDMPLVRMLCSMVPGARQMADHHVVEEMKFELPSTERASYGAFFAALEPRKEELGVSSYGIAMAPLEEVFVRVGCESVLAESNPMQQALLAAESAVDGEGNAVSEDTQVVSASMYSSFGQDVHYKGTFIGQTVAIFRRRMQLASAGLGVHISKHKDKSGKERWLVEPRGIHTLLLVLMPIAATVVALYLRRYRPQVLSTFPVKADKLKDRYGKRTKKIGPTFEVMPNFFAAFVIVAGWLFAPGFYAEVLVVERQKKIRNLMTVMGLNPAAYWLGQSAADSIFWLVPMLLSFLIFPIMDASGTVIDEWVKPSFFCCSILFGFEMQSFAYLYSFGFKMWGAASSTGPIVLLALIIMPLVMSLLITQMTYINDREGDSNAAVETRRDNIPFFLTWSMFLDLAAIVSPHGAYLSAMICTFWPEEMADWMDGDERMRYQHMDGVREWWGGEFNKTAYARRKELYTRAGVLQKWGGDGTGPGYFNESRGEIGAIMSYKYTPLWGIILCQVIKIAAFSLGVYWLDTAEFREHAVPPLTPTSDEDMEALDEDVRVENERVNANEVDSPLGSVPVVSAVDTVDGSDNAADDDSVVVQHLRKIYPAPTKTGVHVAVKDMNYGVHEGECFGLLGPNGAGKSTTVSMLTRHTAATRGEAKVKGRSVNTDFLEAAKSLGVVTQDNTLYDELSALEHLELFSKIRGVSEEHLDSTVQDALNLMELDPHKLKQSQRLSGGMKRKLCTAMSLIGNPEVVLMDEPSAGLDPVSRRNLWCVIRETMASRSVILTTHLLDEAEALCARIGIMTHGTMRCLGSSQHLRSKFGSVFELVVSVDPLRVKEQSASSAKQAKQAAFERLDTAVQDLFRPDDWDERVRRLREERQAAREAARATREERGAEEGGQAGDARTSGVELVALPQAEALEGGMSSPADKSSVEAVMPAGIAGRKDDGGGEEEKDEDEDEDEDKPAKLVSRHSNMLTYQVPVEFVNVGTVFDTMETRKDELCVSNYVISQPTLEQVFLSFVNEDEDGLSASKIEESIESAFDDEDRRRADASKPRCCGLLRETHKRNARTGCFLCPLFCIFFSFFFLMDDLLLFLGALDSEKMITSFYPVDELYTEPTCRGDLDDQDLAYFKPWSAPSLTTENRIDDDERQKTHGFATLTRNVIFPRESKRDMYCGAIVVPFAWNQNWKVKNMNLSVGLSGDFDASCNKGKYDPKINEYSCDDIWDSNMRSEWFTISVVGHNSTKIRNPYFDGKMFGSYPKWMGNKKKMHGSHWSGFEDHESWSNEIYWNWGRDMTAWDAQWNMEREYNKLFTFETVAECMPDGEHDSWRESRQNMWTGWKFSIDETWTHDNGACATDYRGTKSNDEEHTSHSLMDGHTSGEYGQCSEVEDKYAAECEYGVIMSSGESWYSGALWYTYFFGTGADQQTETQDTTNLCGCEKATEANGECSGNHDGSWKAFQGSCYSIVNGGNWLSFAFCSAMCAEMNATMPCIASQEENDYLSDLRPRWGENLGFDGDINQDMQGRCTLDCPHQPSYETCAENMVLVKDNSMKYSDGRDALEGDIALLLEPGWGAGIDTCESGLQAQAVLTLQYSCDSTTPQPSRQPSPLPILAPTPVPTLVPSLEPSPLPTRTGSPSLPPSLVPTTSPTLLPTAQPQRSPSAVPTKPPTTLPTLVPSPVPTISDAPTKLPSLAPSPLPTLVPSPAPTGSPVPSVKPTPRPTPRPSISVDCGITEPLTRDVYANVSDAFCVSQRKLQRYPAQWAWWFVALWWMGGTFVLMCLCIGGILGMCCTKRDEEDEARGRKSKGKYCFGAC